MASERPDHTLQATALVHEAYVRLADVGKAQHWNSCGYFFSAAAEAVWRILVESARSKKSLKRDDDRTHVELDSHMEQTIVGGPHQLIELSDSRHRLGEDDQEAADLVKLRLFARLTVAEVGQAGGIHRGSRQASRTVQLPKRIDRRDFVSARRPI